MFRYIKLSAILLCLMMPFVFAACGDDDDDEPTIEKPSVSLVASPGTLSLLSEKGATVSFSVKCNTTWVITGIPEWLNLSATSGNGDGDVVVTALSTNSDDAIRTATIIITAGDETAQIVINQLAAFVSDCTVGFSDILPMTTSIAFMYDIKPDVSYFYAGFLDISAAGWTDERIIKTLTDEDRFDPKSSEATGLQGFRNMDPDTEYYLCTVAFNDKGEQGKLTKVKVKTLKFGLAIPLVTVDNVRYNSTQWFWNTTMNAYTNRYYMIGLDGTYAYIYNYAFTEAEIAWLIKKEVEEDALTPIANSSSWNMDRDQYSEDVMIATWGVDINGDYSPRLYIFYSSISDSYSYTSARNTDDETSKRTCIPSDTLSRLRSDITILN